MPNNDYSDMIDQFARLVSNSDWSRIMSDSLPAPQQACYECELPSRNLYTLDEHALCTECHGRQHVPCSCCGEQAHRSVVTDGNFSGFICPTCVSQYIPCHVCNMPHHPRNGYEIRLQDETIVRVCGGACDSTIRRQCADCGQYHFLPFDRCLIKYPVLPTEYVECYLPNRQFSVELETSKKLDNPKGWTSVTDGSVSGLEYLSGPILGQSAIALIESGCAALNQDGPVVDARCGYHIHLNARDLSEEQVVKFLKLCFKYQDDVAKLVPKSRSFERNRYCARLPDRFGSNIPLEEMIYPRRDGYEESDHRRYMVESKKYKYYDGRYFWANAHSYYYRGTVEIRLHSGTTLPERILNWAELWLKLLEYAVSPDVDSTYFGRAGFYTVLERANVRPETIKYYKNREKKFHGVSEIVAEPPVEVVQRPRRAVRNMWVDMDTYSVPTEWLYTPTIDRP